MILEGVDAEKGGEDQGGEDIVVRFDAKTFQLKSISDNCKEILDKILKRAGKDIVHLKKEALKDSPKLIRVSMALGELFTRLFRGFSRRLLGSISQVRGGG